ncbi:MAG: hypothetical protein WA061_02140 [Microgenomates group bacterium]
MYKKNGKMLDRKYDVKLDIDELKHLEQSRIIDVLDMWECSMEYGYTHTKEELGEFVKLISEQFVTGKRFDFSGYSIAVVERFLKERNLPYKIILHTFQTKEDWTWGITKE